jgi:hypothetical protein
MTKTDHHPDRDHSSHSHAAHGGHAVPWSQRWHKDWRLWTVVALMLIAMAVYVLSLDESLRPGGGSDQEPVPAAP